MVIENLDGNALDDNGDFNNYDDNKSDDYGGDNVFNEDHGRTPQWGAADAEIKVPSGENRA